jgi:hypothetical protein
LAFSISCSGEVGGSAKLARPVLLRREVVNIAHLILKK